MRYVEYFRQEICSDGELCEAITTLLLLSFVGSVLVTCIGSLT